ncbi:MAG: hypothetical protein HUJ58_10290 [Erysipelotrichaceae bacterium]|nr:hypothetical protein [Erysipelotrichaceae bacterium]
MESSKTLRLARGLVSFAVVWYGTSGGGDTKDTVFLLSPEEAVCKYFGNSSDLLIHPKKNQRYRFERKDPNTPKRVAYLSWKKEQVWWWIRIKEE